ncbi:U32 family peptidase [Candidatus Falkowbacteria bacterium]|nr:U32 family peptidase [Candidatus Falkowbacteria bacterium]NCT55049.1 U32 family peptidase [Candidatus Falkowbacteria bacterium]
MKLEKKKKLELLAPAGNFNKLKTALAYGADAVYLGIPDFSLRVRINDFDLKTLKEGADYAHRQGKKVYITINIFAHNEHLKALPKYLKALKDIKPDALIISDPGIIALAKKYLPKVEIHLSTQANCTNLESAKFWTKQGISRIILGREVTLKEIKEIKKALPKVELEYFIHGAMCMAYSGRCFLSKLFVNRSANLGDCAQPCRWEFETSRYTLKAERHEAELELVEERHGSYLLNSRDLNLIKHLKELIEAGVTSFKIEGRAKSDYYLATVCGSYRRALDLIFGGLKGNKLKKELEYLNHELETKLVHRGYTSGFLLGEKADQNIKDAKNESKWEYCGQVVKVKKNKESQTIYFKVHNTIKAGELLEVIGKNYDIIKIKPKAFFESDPKGNLKTEKITEAHGGGGAKVLVLELKNKEFQGKEVFPLAVLRRLKK